MASSATANALTQASTGLTYQSETDTPWKVFCWPTAEGEPTPQNIRKQGKHKPDSPVEGQPLDEFFAPLVQEQDWFGDAEKADAAKYQALLLVVKQNVRNPKVIKVGDRKRVVYVIGVDPQGGWVGLKTTAVET